MGGGVGSKKGENPRHVIGIAEAAERDAFKYFCFHLVGEFARGDVGPDQARRYAIDTDAIGPELARHRLCESKNSGLCGGIVRSAKDAAATLCRDGRHAGDGSSLAPTHMRDDRL